MHSIKPVIKAYGLKKGKKHGNYGSPTTKNEKGYFEAVIKMYNTIEKQNVSEIISKAKIEPDGRKLKMPAKIEPDGRKLKMPYAKKDDTNMT
ncbi:hypothetical protein DVH24_031375 [Malus domestica]|uniref:Uncharacterized protein n=1 Tax=Malus domestica TaxID=3750 RepID=A0A498HGP0_MALDO|nr:hypothetical protein DVH24_031375 [Malus domestica]